MIKQLHFKTLLLMAMMLLGAGTAWAQDVTYDIANNFSVSNGELTDGTVSFIGSGPDNFKMNTGYFMMGKNGAYINFPTYDSPVEKIVVTGRSGASSSTKMNIYVGDVAVSKETVGCTETNTYEIASDYQAAGTQYTLKVTSNHNAQITKIEVYFAGGSQLQNSDLTLLSSELTFDLNNNNGAQRIEYTTSSTGGVTVSQSDYIDAEVDTSHKVILVTPKKKTNGAVTITVNQAADNTYKAGTATFTVTVSDSTPKTGSWALTNLADLTEGDVFIIVGKNGDNYAMSNDKGTGSAPTAVEVTIEDDEITSDVADNIKWNISGNATDGYIFYPNGTTETWLYCTNTNNGVRVGTNEDNAFVIKENYLYHNGTTRYLGIYNSQDWRCYTSINTNIQGQTFAFYKYEDNAAAVKRPVITVPETFVGSTTAEITCATEGATIYYSFDNSTWTEYSTPLTITATTTIYAKAKKGNDESAVVSKTTTKTLPKPTVTINPDGITNTNVFNGTAAGKLTAVVSYNDGAIQGATVTWSGDKDEVATINASTGAVTLVGAGKVIFTATFAGNNDYAEASATYELTVTNINPNAIDNISDITATGTYTVKGTIVAKSQRGFIVGDGTGYVYYYNQNYTQADYNIGDMVKLSGPVVVYGGVFEFNNTTTVTAATESSYQAENPTVLSGSDMDTRVASTTPAQLSSYVQYQGTLTVDGTHYNITNIEGAKTAIGSISYPISTDFTSLNGKTVKVSGYYVGISSSKYYNTIIGSVEEVASNDPIITVDPATVNLAADATSGEFGYSITNPVVGTALFVASTVDWISNITVDDNKVTFTTTANEGEAREATITLTYGNLTKDVTVKQAAYVAPAQPAALPFAFDGGKADVVPASGMTQEGLGNDYNSSPKLRFDHTGDYLILSFDERPGKLTFDIKGNTFSEGTFTVQTSEDGVTYTDLETYTELGATQSEEFNNLGENVRYIKWIYTEKVNGNVALGNIKLLKYGQIATYTLEVTELTNVNMFVFAGDESEMAFEGVGSANVAEGTEVLLSVDVEDGFVLQSLTVDGTDVTSQIDESYAYTFNMPGHNVIITAIAVEDVHLEPGNWVEASLSDLLPGDVIVIVGNNGDNYAMSHESGSKSAPKAVKVNVVQSTLSGDIDATLQWNVTYQEDGYVFYPNGDDETWLYCTNSNNGVRVGKGDAMHFSLSDEGYLTTTETTEKRYIGIYNSEEWRCYTSINANIKEQSFKFYKKLIETEGTATITLNAACHDDAGMVYGTFSHESSFVVPEDLTVSEVGIDNDGKLVVKSYLTNAVVPANTGVLVAAAEGGDYTVNLTTDEGTSLKTVENALRPSGPNGITAEQMADPTGDYYYYRLTMHKGTQIGFWWGAEKGAAFPLLVANKAYLKVPKAEGAREGFAFGDETTGISHMLLNGEQPTHVYDLQGRSVAQPTKGLYIVNGKKVVVK